MKTTKQIATLFLLATLIFSCNKKEDFKEPTSKNPERFTNVEAGNSEFKAQQSGTDLHIDFDYKGNAKVKEITLKIKPTNVGKPNEKEKIWEVDNHIVSEEQYKDQINPHIHYHIFYDEVNTYNPEKTPVTGMYTLTITVTEIDDTVSFITQEFEIVKKFDNLEVGENFELKKGAKQLPVKFNYNSGNNTVEEITVRLQYKEWRENESVKVGEWNHFSVKIPKADYDPSNAFVNYLVDVPEFPVGKYWLLIFVKETGEKEQVYLGRPFDVVNP